MSDPARWQRSLARFFAERATELGDAPSFEDLCYVSGRDPRLWQQPGLYDDMIASIMTLTASSRESEVLEVGCAAGLIARGVAPHVGRYTGVDLARAPLAVARRLGLPNASFRRADGARLPFRPASFDAAFCYDVFTNFPNVVDGVPVIADMTRVVRPGGRVLVGSIPDLSLKGAFETRVAEVAAALDAKYGTLPPRPTAPRRSIVDRLTARFAGAQPEIVCYYFRREDFVAIGESLGVETEILDIHTMNPYFGYRFNVVYRKSAK